MVKFDLYDEKFNKTDISIEETDEIPDNLYHLSVECWIINSKKEILLIRNALNYNRHYPGFWSCIGDNVISGETKEEAILRIIYSRIGIKLSGSDLFEVETNKRDPYSYMYVTYIIKKDIDLKELIFNDNFALQANWNDIKDVYKMIDNGEIAWYLIPRIEKYVIPLIK